MRPIKFRAIQKKIDGHKTDPNMYEVTSIRFWDENGVRCLPNDFQILIPIASPSENATHAWCSTFSHYVMQFTGLIDKNGKEIFESDILIPVDMHDSNIDFWHTPEGQTMAVGNPYEVKWWNHGWDVPCDPGYWEVLGNVWENPELLK